MDDRLTCPKCRGRFTSVHLEGESVQCPKCEHEMFNLTDDHDVAITKAMEWFPSYLSRRIRTLKAGGLIAFIRARLRVAMGADNKP